jgi:hypothetical protein
MTNGIKEKLWNIELVVEEIKKFPQTYKTILGEYYKDGTCQLILRRKINTLCKEGTICKTTIPGTRFGQVILYTLPKTYYIIVESGRLSNNVYCFFDYKKVSRFYISISKCWKLDGIKWNEVNNETILFEGNVLKFI